MASHDSFAKIDASFDDGERMWGSLDSFYWGLCGAGAFWRCEFGKGPSTFSLFRILFGT